MGAFRLSGRCKPGSRAFFMHERHICHMGHYCPLKTIWLLKDLQGFIVRMKKTFCNRNFFFFTCLKKGIKLQELFFIIAFKARSHFFRCFLFSLQLLPLTYVNYCIHLYFNFLFAYIFLFNIIHLFTVTSKLIHV